MLRRLTWDTVLITAQLGSVGPCSGQIAVGSNVQVSSARPRVVHDEVTVAADPNTAGRLLACVQAYPAERFQPFALAYASTDAGRTWAPVIDLSEKPSADLNRPRFVDVDCTFSSDGSAYFVAHASIPPDGGPPEAWVFRSPDGGGTWLPRTVVSNVADRPFIVCDRTGGPYHGRVYLSHATEIPSLDSLRSLAGIALRVSIDGGKTYGLVTERVPTPGVEPAFVYPLYGVVLSDGALVVPVVNLSSPDSLTGSLKILRSTDGGATLSPALLATELQLAESLTERSPLPGVAVDPGSTAFRDRLYIVWADRRSGRSEIWFTSSHDEGKTWTTPRVISDDQPRSDGHGPDNFRPAIAVSPSGVVGVSWYDRRNNSDNAGYFVRFRASLDGGETWLPSVRVSEQPQRFDQREQWSFWDVSDHGSTANLMVRRLPRTYFNGDHAGIAADADGVFHPVWVDNRTGISQVWTAPVSVRGTVGAHGGGELAHLADVSSKVALEVVRTVLDRATNTLTVTARLRNESADTIRGPVKVRALSLSSEFGNLTARNAENHRPRDGAVWDFSPELADGRLLPGSSSGEQRLEFALKNLRPFRQGSLVREGVVAMIALILAGTDR